MKRIGWVAAIALVLLANAVLLAGAWWNRTGEVTTDIVLTERELRLVGGEEENSALALSLQWGPRGWNLEEPEWFDREALARAGFDTSLDPEAPEAARFYRRQLPRRAWIALEYDGPAWRAWREKRETAVREESDPSKGGHSPEWLESQLRGLRQSSRLRAVDIDADASRLRQRHPDREGVLIARGIVRLQYQEPPPDEDRPPRVKGDVIQLLVDRIHVPVSRAAALSAIRAEGRNPPWLRSGPEEHPRYEVRLRFGRRGEPWVEEARPLGSPE